MRKFLIRNPSVRFSLIFTLSLICLAVSLVPILLLGKYDVPYADDFSFSCETHAAVQSGGGILQIFSGAISKVRDVYYTWQGTFSGIFLMAFQPGIFGLSGYSLTPWIMLTGLLSGIFIFFYSFFSDSFGLSLSATGILAVAVSFCCIQLVPSPNQSFYWYNGAIYYTFTFGITLICYASVLRFARHGGWFRLVFILLLSIIIGGSNFVTALETVILFFCFICLLLVRKNRRWKALLFPFFAVLIALLISALAPGNSLRQAEYPDTPSPLRAVLLSFTIAAKFIPKFVSLPFLGMLLFLVPVFYFTITSGNAVFSHPILSSLFSFCVFASLFTPHIYAEGTAGPNRLINLYYYFFVLLSVIDLFLWIGFFRNSHHSYKFSNTYNILNIQNKKDILVSGRKVQKIPVCNKNYADREIQNPAVGLPFGTLFCSGATLVLCLTLSLLMHISSFTSLMALGELRSGEAQEYYRQALIRQDVLEDSSIKDCVFEPYTVQPYLLFFGDMCDNPSDYANSDTATFYKKNTIVVKSSNS